MGVCVGPAPGPLVEGKEIVGYSAVLMADRPVGGVLAERILESRQA